MDHHCPSDNIIHRKSISFHRQVCVALACQQRRQVACVFRMCLTSWIIMAFRFGKVYPRAAFPLMNMESEESCFTSSWQAGNPRHNQYASILLIKLNVSDQLRYFHSTLDLCHRIRAFSAILHWITSYQTMLPDVFCNRSGFEHRVQHPEVVEKFFSKVLKNSRIFQFCGHCILKNATLSTGCHSIMGQNMGQTLLREIAEFQPELFSP